MGEVIPFVPKSERERARLIREARAIYDSVFPPSDPVREQTVTTSDFGDVSMQSCLRGAPQLADWMNQHPTERLAAWRCVFGKKDGRGA